MKISKSLKKVNLGEELKFCTYPVQLFYEPLEKEYYIECKEVYIKYSDYLLWKTDIRKNIIGFNKEGVGCKAVIRNNTVRVGCLLDSENNFNKIEIIINKLINYERSASKNSKTKKS